MCVGGDIRDMRTRSGGWRWGVEGELRTSVIRSMSTPASSQHLGHLEGWVPGQVSLIPVPITRSSVVWPCPPLQLHFSILPPHSASHGQWPQNLLWLLEF